MSNGESVFACPSSSRRLKSQRSAE